MQELSPFRINVSDLGPGDHRDETLVAKLEISVDSAVVSGESIINMKLEGLSDGVVATGTIGYDAALICNRCLANVAESRSTSFLQVFASEPDQDGRVLEDGHTIDVEAVVHDEVVLDLPLAPLCRPDCLGLCSYCGTDLNTAPCSGHTDDSNHPFAVLQQLLEPQDE